MSAAMEEAPAEAAKRASGSSFYAAMRILPRARREAMFEIYSFCRAVDDIADEPGPVDLRVGQLRGWRQDIDALYARDRPPHLQALARAIDEFALRREDFIAVIDGMEMDLIASIQAPDFATLDLYCDRVASAVGRLSVRVFGMEDQAGLGLAHHLGRALQFTNILRDIDEDAAIGRLYLPREALDEAGIAGSDPVTVLASPRIGVSCDWLVVRARDHFGKADRVMAGSSRSVVRAPRIMGGAYRLILDRLVARGWQPPRTPIKLRRRQFLWILLSRFF